MQESFKRLIALNIDSSSTTLVIPSEQHSSLYYFFKDAYEGDLPKKNLENHRRALTVKRKAGTITAEE
jgi:hypothetical protein